MTERISNDRGSYFLEAFGAVSIRRRAARFNRYDRLRSCTSAILSSPARTSSSRRMVIELVFVKLTAQPVGSPPFVISLTATSASGFSSSARDAELHQSGVSSRPFPDSIDLSAILAQ